MLGGAEDGLSPDRDAEGVEQRGAEDRDAEGVDGVSLSPAE